MHIQVFLDLATLYIQLNEKNEALLYFEKAFAIFELFKNSQIIKYASTALSISKLYLSQGYTFWLIKV